MGRFTGAAEPRREMEDEVYGTVSNATVDH